jgi:hypothetical protein
MGCDYVAADDLELIALPHQFCRWADNLLS